MSARRSVPRAGARPAPRPGGTAGRAGLVRPEFQPTLPALLRGRGRWTIAIIAVVVVTVVGALVAGRAAGSDAAPATLVHTDPPFTLLFASGDLRRVDPRGDEHVRLEGRGRFTSVSVSVGPLPRSPGGTAPALADLPILADRMVDRLRRGHEDFAVLAEGRARVNGAPGYQVRYRSGPDSAPRFGHDVLLLPAAPSRDAGLLVSLDQRNERPRLGPEDRRIAHEAKRAFRSVRFGTERP